MQTHDELYHYGRRGMRWGIRNKSAAGSGQTRKSEAQKLKAQIADKAAKIERQKFKSQRKAEGRKIKERRDEIKYQKLQTRYQKYMYKKMKADSRPALVKAFISGTKKVAAATFTVAAMGVGAAALMSLVMSEDPGIEIYTNT